MNNVNKKINKLLVIYGFNPKEVTNINVTREDKDNIITFDIDDKTYQSINLNEPTLIKINNEDLTDLIIDEIDNIDEIDDTEIDEIDEIDDTEIIPYYNTEIEIDATKMIIDELTILTNEDEEEIIEDKKPRGWHFKKVFVDKFGNVYHKGVIQPELKGTLPSDDY